MFVGFEGIMFINNDLISCRVEMYCLSFVLYMVLVFPPISDGTGGSADTTDVRIFSLVDGGSQEAAE